MRRAFIIYLLFILLLVMAICGCNGKSDSLFIIDIFGTDGLSFTGNLLAISSDGSINSRSVEGNVPAHYAISGYTISCMFQKQSQYGTLNVTVAKNDKVVATGGTQATYGIVSLSTPWE